MFIEKDHPLSAATAKLIYLTFMGLLNRVFKIPLFEICFDLFLKEAQLEDKYKGLLLDTAGNIVLLGYKYNVMFCMFVLELKLPFFVVEILDAISGEILVTFYIKLEDKISCLE